ncbi:LysR family transcriptional regulator [uncultured Mailhella sp.]|uniref:LysR family transcriptional regulator n=1 Tax=uncultured Mailhella sp. TaxID=1981031 RepID=UPI00260B2290|nr:LysR family transcriptional regulator [uncultured Mailhella sp.]
MYDHHLKAFVLAAECGSFSRAAERLYISPNALLKHVNLLENSLGVALLERSPRGVSLTRAGRYVYGEAKIFMERAEQVRLQAKRLSETADECIRLGSSLMCPGRPIVKLWSRVSVDYPEIRLQIVPIDDTDNSNIGELGSKDASVDMVASLIPSTRWGNRHAIVELGRIPLAVAVPLTHPLASHCSIRVEDLFGETVLMVRRGDTSHVDALRNWWEEQYPQIHIEDVAPYSLNTFNQCAAENKPMISAELWQDVHPALVTVSAEWGERFSVPYGIIHRREASPAMQKFLQVINAVFDAH